MARSRENARYHAGAISRTHMEILLGADSAARITSEIEWLPRTKMLAGRTDLVTGLVLVNDAYLRMYWNTPRPWHIRFQYIGARVPIRRVCVNGSGHRLGVCTHVHTYRTEDGTESCERAPDSFPTCGVDADVTNNDRRIMFEAFAALCHVNLGAYRWIDPPDYEEAD